MEVLGIFHFQLKLSYCFGLITSKVLVIFHKHDDFYYMHICVCMLCVCVKFAISSLFSPTESSKHLLFKICTLVYKIYNPRLKLSEKLTMSLKATFNGTKNHPYNIINTLLFCFVLLRNSQLDETLCRGEMNMIIKVS